MTGGAAGTPYGGGGSLDADAGLGTTPDAGAAGSPDAVAAGPAAEVYPAYIAAILEADRLAAFGAIEDARAKGASLGSLYIDVFQPALREIGRLWQDNAIGVADEHAATAITQAAMARSFEHAFNWGSRRRHRLVAACADLERHEVGLRMICDLLELDGWDTTYLGATVPVDSLVDMVAKKRPDAVALSVALAPHVPRLRTMIDALRTEFDDPPLILAGGRPFIGDSELAARVGADLTAPDAVRAVELLQQRFA